MWRELGAFLREKRRTARLRREDVADAAGMGYDWYVRIEQGRARASIDALTRVAAALELDRAETRYVLALAGAVDGSAAGLPEHPVPPSVLRVMHAQEPSPAYVVNTLLDLVAWNEASAAFYAIEWDQIPPVDRNIVRLMLTDPVLAVRVVDCDRHARQLVHRCRALWAGRSTEPAVVERVGRMAAESEPFRRWWAEPVPEAFDLGPVRKTIRDDTLGEMHVEQTAWAFGAGSEHILILSSPLDEQTAAGLELLAGRRAAGERAPARERVLSEREG